MKSIIIIIFSLLNTSILSQSLPAMAKSNDLKEVDVRIGKQRAANREIKIKDIKRKENKSYRKDRITVRNSEQIRKKVQTKINKNERKSKKNKPLKKLLTNKKGHDKKLQRAKRFREKDNHVTKNGRKGFQSRKARRRLPPRNTSP